MIQLTRLNGNPLVLNSDMVKLIENTPDSVITLVNGEKIVVRESSEQILERIVEFRRRVLRGLPLNFSGWTAESESTPENKPRTSSSEEA
jgi:flagellar protein FlbD